jgi:hypothetical protein
MTLTLFWHVSPFGKMSFFMFFMSFFDVRIRMDFDQLFGSILVPFWGALGIGNMIFSVLEF